MIIWRALPAWTFRAWPVLAMAPFIAGHVLALHLLPTHVAVVHKVTGMFLQVLGGLLILVSINANLGLFRKQSLAGAFIAWLREFPIQRSHVIHAGTGMANATGRVATVSVGKRAPVSLEERIAEIESQLREVRNELRTQVEVLGVRIDAAKVELSAQIQRTEGKISALSEQVEKATVGGFKLQAFGVLLAVYGAFTSVLA